MLDTVSVANAWSNEKELNLSNKFPLHRACRDGNTEQLKNLLEQLGQQLQNTPLINNEEEDYKWTAAHFASYFGNVECLQLLHQATVAYNGLRVSQGLPEIKSPLVSLSSECQQTPLQVASFANHPQCVEWLVKQAGVPINCKDSSGETALHKACRSGAMEVVQVLSTCDTDAAVRNNLGLTAADVAAVSGHMPIATLITGRNIVNPTSIISGSGYYGYQATPVKKPGCDLLSSDALARDEVPIAGKKRGRCAEEETENLSKRARLGDDTTSLSPRLSRPLSVDSGISSPPTNSSDSSDQKSDSPDQKNASSAPLYSYKPFSIDRTCSKPMMGHYF